MAGDWMKVEKATSRKPEILRISAILNIHPDHAFGTCLRFWSWCDDNLTTGNVSGVTVALVDALLGFAGFGDALISVGWLRVRDGSLEVPNFDRHLSESAKNRALTAQRVAKCKAKKSNDEVTVAALPEKRREEKKELDSNESNSPPNPRKRGKRSRDAPKSLTLPDNLKTPEFQAAWLKWVTYRKELGKRLTATGARQLMARFSEFGPSRAIEAIENSIANGYQGIFETGSTPRGEKRDLYAGLKELALEMEDVDASRS